MMAALDTSMPPEWAQLGFIPGKAMRMFGMRRSGNHAISDWILRNAPHGRSVFLNNCKAARTPLEHFATIEVNGGYANTRKARRGLADQTQAAAPDGLFLISYEDLSPADFAGTRRPSGGFSEDLLDADILIYRSFLNWSASLLKKLQANDGYSLSRRAAIVLRTIERYTRLLALVSDQEERQVIGICYDDWFASPEYRATILRRLQLHEADNSIGTVQRYGGGSSFQKEAASAADLQTDQRWRQMADDPEYQAILMLAARDGTLLAQLGRHFPNDVARLASIAKTPPMPAGILF